ncbi:hypothetical protein FIV06_09090 [Labrenzia sp. THAF191b]|uniref:hypothetical protein n=1 Tax=unclassified Labrenzia TaxID=2648686 RepID=UPI001267EB4A|nr:MULTISPECIES: hypothetical protein [unclassified Labrenzia]QFS97575.1 hypothetical protein FIV06_09090 [Labrenzia sp. THAF191b]QFT03890.1 hypothetical protein FIV05_09090 [Labrenzia sp. THAF191a]QFT15432.1 hypothetical protein FIV03_09095 [Labrenzia sp. THAF187b]
MQKTPGEEAAYLAGRMDAQVLANLYFAGLQTQPPDLSGLGENARSKVIGAITTDICELPDRNSPDDHPDMMLLTPTELDLILRRHLFGED